MWAEESPFRKLLPKCVVSSICKNKDFTNTPERKTQTHTHKNLKTFEKLTNTLHISINMPKNH